MKIAFIGQKGVPVTFGGVEQHVEELAARLAARGHEIAIYVRDWYTPPEITNYRGSSLIHTPTIKTKHMDAFVHSFSSSIHCLFQGYDIVHYHAIGPSFFSWIPKMLGKRVLVTIHGYDYAAGKWGKIARLFLKMSEKVALSVPHRTIAVSKHQSDFYRSLGYDITYIKNGVTVLDPLKTQDITKSYGLHGQDYILFLGRLVPEKRVDWLLQAYLKAAPSSIKLVIAGRSSATDKYVAMLKQIAADSPNIIFTGNVTGRLKAELLSNARLFVTPSAVEGLPIAILEAMSYGVTCLASDIQPHKEVITDGVTGFLFNHNDQEGLLLAIKRLLSASDHKLNVVKESARKLVASDYSWDNAVDKLEAIYQDLLANTP